MNCSSKRVQANWKSETVCSFPRLKYTELMTSWLHKATSITVTLVANQPNGTTFSSFFTSICMKIKKWEALSQRQSTIIRERKIKKETVSNMRKLRCKRNSYIANYTR